MLRTDRWPTEADVWSLSKLPIDLRSMWDACKNISGSLSFRAGWETSSYPVITHVYPSRTITLMMGSIKQYLLSKIHLSTSSLKEPLRSPTPSPICVIVCWRVGVATSEGSSLSWFSWLLIALTKEISNCFYSSQDRKTDKRIEDGLAMWCRAPQAFQPRLGTWY